MSRRLAASSFLCLLVSVALAGPAAAQKKATSKRRTASVAEPPVYDPWVVGVEELKQKLFAAEQSGRRLVVNFGTNDCAPCRVVCAAMFEKKFLDETIPRLIPTTIDVTPGSRNAQMLTTYGFDPSKGLPVLLVFGPDRAEVAATRNGEAVAAAKKGTAAVQELIRRYVPPAS